MKATSPATWKTRRGLVCSAGFLALALFCQVGCDQKEESQSTAKTEQEIKHTKRSERASPTASFREDWGTKKPEEQYARMAALLNRMFLASDEAGLKDVEEYLRDYPLNGHIVGKQFIASVPQQRWKDALKFVDRIDTTSIKYPMLMSMHAWTITANSTDGIAIFRDLAVNYPGENTEQTMNPDLATDEGTLWNFVGWTAASDTNERQIDRSFLSMITDNEDFIDSYRIGVGGGVQQSLSEGKVVDVTNILKDLPESMRPICLNNIASGLDKAAGKNALGLKQLLAAFEATPGTTEWNFQNFGHEIHRDVFEEQFLMAGDPESPHFRSLVAGWASAMPRDSVEIVVDQTASPKLAGAAFSTWTEADSMEASNWLQTQPAGPVKDSCTEQLCDYLLKKGSTEEAKVYLETLPADARERLKAKYPRQ